MISPEDSVSEGQKKIKTLRWLIFCKLTPQFLADNHQDWITSLTSRLKLLCICRWMAGWVTVTMLWCLIRPTALLLWTLAWTDSASSTLRALTNPTQRTTVTHRHTIDQNTETYCHVIKWDIHHITDSEYKHSGKLASALKYLISLNKV